VFESSQASVTNKFMTNFEQTIKWYFYRLDKFEHLFEENHNSVKSEEQTATIQSILIEYMEKIDASLQHIKENTDKLKTISEVLSPFKP